MKISPSIFEAFLKCPTKSWLRFTAEPTSGNEYAEWVQTENESYRAEAARQMMANAPTNETASPSCNSRREEAHYSAENLKTAKWRFAFDLPIETDFRSSRGHEAPTTPPENDQSLLTSVATIVESRLHAVERIPSAGRGKAAQFIPIRFIYRNKLTKNDKLLLAYDAFVLSQVINRPVTLGKITHGDDHSALKVKTSALAGDVRKRLDRIVELLANPAPPDLVLNRHCGECEFQARCRKIAVEKDDLSLLANMSAKERQKLRSKGIFTVTQLSYTFRPRRRPKRQREKKEKYHHSLKALAIREQKIHIVGSPELKIEGTPVYLDVEGLPDRDFYYLIGLRIGNGDSAVQHSLWADTISDEGKIWREFLAILETVEQPVLIHYGSYETTFLKRMSERYGSPKERSTAAKSICSSLNLLSFIFGRIYFPTYTNSLKETAYFVGARWTSSVATGLQTIGQRQHWINTHNRNVQSNLLIYNQDDCTALDVLTTAVLNVIANPESRTDVDFADAPKNFGTARATEIYRTFNAVLQSAHSDYSKSRIKLVGTGVPTRATILRKPKSQPERPKLPTVKGRIIRVARKRKCQRHPDHPTMLVPTKKSAERSVIDLAFTTTGCRKSVLRFVGKRGRCPHCGQIYLPPTFKQVHHMVYGPGFSVWVVYLRMALRLSYRLISQVSYDLFGLEFPAQSVERFVSRCAQSHTKTEQYLLEKILQSPALHVDETKLSILGHHQYVWVLTDGRHVVFRLTEGRETGFLEPLVAEYQGTLVSDFYGGYDALPCSQQKCLVHLIRDLNDDLWKNPFNVDLENFVASVRDLLLPMLADVQRFGLKIRHLQKHRKRVKAFYQDAVDDQSCGQELIAKYQKRFERYRESLFTFLERDGIPWNNNAAERALRHVAVQRKISGAFSSKGAQDYLRLLGVAQSCRFQEKSFLGFLRSGLQDVDAYKEARRRRRRSSSGKRAAASSEDKTDEKQSS